MRKCVRSFVVAGGVLLLLTASSLGSEAQHDFEQGVAAQDRGDVIAAMELLRRAADKGHSGAMTRLAYLLDKAEENKAAFELYTLAAAAGNAEAALALGVMYANGEGVEKDAGKALEWITRAADEGLGPAIVTLAQVYLRGDFGVPPSRERALELLKKGVLAGYEPAKRELEIVQTGKSRKAKK